MKNEKRKKATIIKEKKRIRKEGPLWEIERLRNCPRLCSGNAGLIVGTAAAAAPFVMPYKASHYTPSPVTSPRNNYTTTTTTQQKHNKGKKKVDKREKRNE